MSISVLGTLNKIPILNKFILSINGESKAKNLDEKFFKKSYLALINLSYQYVRIDSNSLYDIEFEIGLRRAGFKRPIMLFQSPLTIYNVMGNNSSRSNSWRRNVNIAKRSNLKFRLESPSEENLRKFINFFNQMSSFKKIKFKLDYKHLRAIMSDSNMKLFSICEENNDH